MTTKYFVRKLTALDYADVNKFDPSDTKQYRFAVSWLENRFICHYDIERRKGLNDVDSSDWNSHYDTYLADLKVPFKSDDPSASLDWLLGMAIENLYIDKNTERKYSELTGEEFRNRLVSTRTTSSLDTLDTNSEEFKKGVYELAKLLGVTYHPDYMRVLKACCSLIEEKFNPKSVEKAKKQEGKINIQHMPLPEVPHSMKVTTDSEIKKVAAILRMLHIYKLRQLQMDINAIIVAVQEIVAEPKTDEKLGKVGR